MNGNENGSHNQSKEMSAEELEKLKQQQEQFEQKKNEIVKMFQQNYNQLQPKHKHIGKPRAAKEVIDTNKFDDMDSDNPY